MIANSINPTSPTPPVRLAGSEESLIQFTLKLKKVVFDVSL